MRYGAVLDPEAELGGERDLAAERRDGLADQVLIRERTVGFRGVEQREAAFEGRPYHLDSCLRSVAGP
jgi:hypothetical protein